MTKKQKERLAPFHIGILIYMAQVGVVVLSLPRMLAETMGYNGWLFLIICSAVASVHIFLIWIVYQMGGGRSIFEILEQSIPKLLLAPLYIGISFLMTLMSGLVIKKYVLIYQMIAFPTTHPMYFAAVVDVLIWLLLAKGIYTISKAITTYFWLVVWLLLLLLFFFRDFEWARLTPFIFQNGNHSGIGMFQIYMSFIGYELCMFLFPYVEKKRFFTSVYAGHFSTTAAYIVMCLVAFGFFSLGQLKLLLFPILEMLSYIRFPFVERIENLFFGLFMITALATAVLYYWAATETMGRLVPKLQAVWMGFTLLAINFMITFAPDNMMEVERWLEYTGLVYICFAVGLPVILILVLLIQNRKGARQHA